MKVNVPIWSKVILGYTETVTGSCRGGYQLMKNVGHYDCLRGKLSVEMVYNGYKYF